MAVKRSIQYIAVIQSLPANEVKTGEDLYNDTIKRGTELHKSKILHRFFNTNNKVEFISALKFIAANASTLSGGIVIHLETHGDENKGLVLADGSLITWSELTDLFREININVCNNLFITMATCFGRNLYLGIDPYKKSPYQAYISASSEVTTDEIIEKFTTLFEKLIECEDLIEAYLAQEKYETNFYYKDSLVVFEESIKLHSSDPNNLVKLEDWLKEYPSLNEMFKGKLTQEIINTIRADSMRMVIREHLKAFDFDDCQ